MNARVKLVVLLLLAVLRPSALWASDPAVTIVWPGTNSRGQVMLTLTTNVRTYTKIVPYGEGSTAASIASSFGAHISMSPSWPVYAKGYPNGTLKMKLKMTSSETVTGIQVCVISGSSCVAPPSGTNFQTGSVLPAGPVLEDALYGFIIAKTDGSSGYDGVGNVVAYQDQVNQQWAATYDSLNRLKSASQSILASQGSTFNVPGGTGVQQYFCWNYDSFGNRTSQIVSGASFADTSSCQPSSSAYHNDISATYDANNRLTSGTGMSGLSYDAAGNLIEDGNYSYKYDGDGRLCATWRHVTGLVTGYLYDAEGTRVAKGSVSSFDCPTTSNFTLTNQYIPGPDGQQMTELDGNGNWIHTNIFAGGSLIATDDTAGRHYQLNDWLGNRRMQVDPNGNIEAYYQAGPYGDLLNNAPITTEHYFTGKERDAESGLDYFKYRMYASSMGRWMSPDPSGLTHADLGNPQSLNLYNYVGNSPLTRADLDGLCWKGFQWACDIGQRVDNLFHGYGFRTDQGVENYLHKANQFLNKHGISTEGMKGPAVMSLYGKTFQTYRRAHLRGGPDYVGRTGGTGTPEQNIAKRGNYQPKTGEYGPPELDKSSSNPNAIRGREQQLIEANGGAQSQGGTSGNAINGISETNPNKSAYMSAAEAEFGAEEGATTAEEVITTIEILNDIPD